MAKRANGEGNIRKRKDGKWLATMPTGTYKADGKREYIYKYCNTQAEALEILERLREEKRAGVSHGKAAMKTGDWVNTWIEKYKAPKLAPATLASYRNNFRVHIKPAIGEIRLRDLSNYHIQKMLDNVGGSYSLFVKVYNVLHGALEKAVELGMMSRNPCKGVAFPKDDKKKMRVLSKEEQKRFIKQLEGEYYRPMLLMYLYTGLRIGEGIPLTWEDINLEERTIWVCKKAIVCHDYSKHEARQVVQDFCKTESSTRLVDITAGLVEVLKVHKEKMMERAEKLGEQWSESNLVFVNTRGNMVYNRNLQESLYKIFAKAGIKGATMHTLRHTYATRCFEVGVDVQEISEQLGHKDATTTRDIYIHLFRDTKRKEIDKLNEIDKLLA